MKTIFNGSTYRREHGNSIPSHSMLWMTLVFSLTLRADQSGDFLYDVSPDTNSVTIYDYVGNGGVVTVPDEIDGLAVTGIGTKAFSGARLQSITLPDSLITVRASAFSGCSGLTSATFGSKVVLIEDYAFFGCFELEHFSISGGLTRIGNAAFENCYRLTSLALPQTVTNIGNDAFNGCYGLMNFALPESVTSIGSNAFSRCSGLKTLTLPGNLNNIEDNTFFACEGLTSFNMGGNVNRIGRNAFYGCYGLTNISIGDSLTNIEENAFAYCSGLTFIALPKSVTTIGSNAFGDCALLTNITVAAPNPSYSDKDGVLFNKDQSMLILCPAGRTGNYDVPETVTSIDNKAFSDCAYLTNLTIPVSITNLPSGLFSGCGNLRSFVIPASITSLPNGVFSGCVKLTNFTVSDLNPNYSDKDGVLFNKDHSVLIQFPYGRSGSYTIPDGVSAIGDSAFAGCAGLVNITLPGSVTNIGRGAFAGCAMLRNVTLPDSVTSVGNGAFSNCTSLATMYFGSGVSNIEDNAFSGCAALTKLYFTGNLPATVGSSVFEHADRMTLYYFAAASGWSANIFGLQTAIWWQSYSQWASYYRLAEKFPGASGEQDDADQDGMTNIQEMLAGTDPTDPKSALVFETTPRAADLSDADKTFIGPDEFAVYFQTMPGKTYDFLYCNSLGGYWGQVATVTATTSQKRVLLHKPAGQGFYRVILHQ